MAEARLIVFAVLKTRAFPAFVPAALMRGVLQAFGPACAGGPAKKAGTGVPAFALIRLRSRLAGNR
jgi:hypothetical protein